jgi:hypothetical protein
MHLREKRIWGSFFFEQKSRGLLSREEKRRKPAYGRGLSEADPVEKLYITSLYF